LLGAESLVARHLEGLVATASWFDGRRCRRSGGG
jgi:hypothetical protein